MPYRRLPNTDLARLHALQYALQRAREADFTEQVIPYKMQSAQSSQTRKYRSGTYMRWMRSSTCGRVGLSPRVAEKFV